MKKYSLTVNGMSYEIRSDKKLEDSFDTTEIVLPDGTTKEVGGIPKVWSDNLDKVVEEDITELMQSDERIRKKRKTFDALIADESVLDNLIEDLTERKNRTKQ